MAKDKGKEFEEDIKKSIPPDYYIERYKDDTAGFYGVSNPADYRIYRKPYLFLFELKSHKGKSLPFSCIRDNQIQGMYKAHLTDGIYAGFIINFRDLEETYYLTVGDVVGYMKNSDRKSIPVEYCRENGVQIPQKKKRTRYSYDMSYFLGMYYGDHLMEVT